MPVDFERRSNSNSRYFLPSRTQPFIITFFQAILAFKRICKFMKRRLGRSKVKKTPLRRMSQFKIEMRKSNYLIASAVRGKPVILASSVPDKQPSVVDSTHSRGGSTVLSPQPSVTSPPHLHHTHHHVLDQKQQEIAIAAAAAKDKSKLLFKAVQKQVEAHYIKVRLGTYTSEMEMFQKSLKKFDNDPKEMRRNARRNAAAIMPSNDISNLFLKNDYFKTLTGGNNAEDGESNTNSAVEEVEYLSGTSIYFGATIALQARHGGFLSYSTGHVKASAHKITSNTRFIVKNSEDLTDFGVMKYGDALWLQAGPTEVLGAQYGSLVDQKRQIQPSLISCKRQSMFKAQQYGRWIILNRDNPMGTIGQPVLHHDRCILEQEWYFLASMSPYESNMYKSINNSDEAMTTKIDLFKPPDECSWKVHLVALPSDDKEDERQRQKLLQQAKEVIDASANGRWIKSQNLLVSLSQNLSANLTEEAVMAKKLKHKKNLHSNQENLFKMYKKLESNGFETLTDPTHFLIQVYGNDSPIVEYKRQIMKVKEQEHNFTHFQSKSSIIEEPKTVIEQKHDDYWNIAQKLLVNTKVWAELDTSMQQYYRENMTKKIEAAKCLQKVVRKYINSKFSYERSMRRVDKAARDKLQEKMMVRKKLIEQVTQQQNERDDHRGHHHGHGHGGGHGSHGGMNNNNSDFGYRRTNQLSSSFITQANVGMNSNSSRRHRNTSMNSMTSIMYADLGNSMNNPRGSINASKLSITNNDYYINAAKMAAEAVARAMGGAIPSSNSYDEYHKNNNSNSNNHSNNHSNTMTPQHRSFSTGAIVNTNANNNNNTNNNTATNNNTSSSPNGAIFHTRSSTQGGRRSIPIITLDRIDSVGNIVPSPTHNSAQHINPKDFPVAELKIRPPSRHSSMNVNNTNNNSNSFNANNNAHNNNTMTHVQEDVGFKNSHHGNNNKQRPQTASAIVKKNANPDFSRTSSKQLLEMESTRMKNKLGMSESRNFGLPSDVFEETHAKISLKTGLKFLQAMASNPDIYTDVGVIKKRNCHSARFN